MSVDPQILIRLLESPNEYERRGAIEELGQLTVSSPATVQALQRVMANDTSQRVRESAAAALKVPAHQAMVENLPSGVAAVAAPADAMSRNRRAVGDLMARSAAFGVLAVFVALWFLLAYGYTPARLLLIFNAAAVTGALYFTSRWVDQGRKAAVLMYSGIIIATTAVNLVMLHGMNGLSWFALAVELFYWLCLAYIWRSGELK